MNKHTGEIENEAGKINEVIITETRRKDGSLDVSFDYKNCPSMAEQHTAHLTDINYLMKKYTPDELTAYLQARSQYREEIVGYDETKEPDLQTAMTAQYQLKQAFQRLCERRPELVGQFKNHVEFLKYVDNPKNQEKLIQLGLITKQEIQQHIKPMNNELNDEQTNNKNESPSKKTSSKKSNEDE